MPELKRTVRVLEDALADAEAAIDWYRSEGGDEIASRFAQEVDAALEPIAAWPFSGRAYDAGTRSVVLRTFPFLVLYRLTRDAIERSSRSRMGVDTPTSGGPAELPAVRRAWLSTRRAGAPERAYGPDWSVVLALPRSRASIALAAVAVLSACRAPAPARWEPWDASPRDARPRDAIGFPYDSRIDAWRPLSEPTDLDAFLAAYDRALCAYHARCAANEPPPGPDPATCRTPERFRATRVVRGILAVRAGAAQVGRETAERCLAAWAARPCDAAFPHEVDAACAAAFERTAHLPCGEETCDFTETCTDRCPTCARESGDGGPSAEGCLPYHEAVGALCVRVRATGELCGHMEFCGPHLACVDNACAWSGPPRLGEPCENECTGDLFCVGAPGARRCEVGASRGEACDLACRGCASFRPCAVGLACADHVCRDIALPGEACDASRVCTASFFCDAGACAPLPGLGEPCARSGRCQVGACIRGVCATAPEGAACERDPENMWAAPCGARICFTDCATCAGPGTCGAIAGLGEPCGQEARAGCAEDALCAGATPRCTEIPPGPFPIPCP